MAWGLCDQLSVNQKQWRNSSDRLHAKVIWMTTLQMIILRTVNKRWRREVWSPRQFSEEVPRATSYCLHPPEEVRLLCHSKLEIINSIEFHFVGHSSAYDHEVRCIWLVFCGFSQLTFVLPCQLVGCLHSRFWGDTGWVIIVSILLIRGFNQHLISLHPY